MVCVENLNILDDENDWLTLYSFVLHKELYEAKINIIFLFLDYFNIIEETKVKKF